MQIINYNNPALSYYGRWYDDGASKYSGWYGSWIRFKFTGTSLKVKADFSNLDSFISVIIDENYPATEGTAGHRFYTTVTGIQTLTVATGLTDVEHTAIVRMYGYPSAILGTNHAKFMGIEIDDGSTITAWNQQGTKRIAVMGDSYSCRSNQFSFFFDQSKYEIYPFGIAGQSMYDPSWGANVTYPYIVKSTIPQDDPLFDGIVIEYGTNDAYGGISTSNFKTSTTDLVQKIKADQPTAKIYLLQMLKNAVNDFSIYGGVLQEVANEQGENVIYIPTSSIWDSITWESDNIHPNIDGMRTLATHVQSYLDTNATASWKIRLNTPTGIEEIPVYPLNQIVDNNLRIFVNNEIQCVKMVDMTDQNASSLRIKTVDGIKSISR